MSKLSPKREDKRKIKSQKTPNKQRTKKIGLTKKSQPNSIHSLRSLAAIGYLRRYSQEKKLFKRKSNLRSLISPKNTFRKAWQTSKRELKNDISCDY